MGLQSQLLKINAENIQQIEAPLMVEWGDGIAVIFGSIKKCSSGCTWGTGNQQLTLDEFIEQWGSEEKY